MIVVSPSPYAKDLTKGARQLHVPLPEAHHALLLDYLDLLIKWNKAYNLTAVRDPDEMVSRHLLDSLSIMPFIENGRWLDVGSGCGMPGIPLSILLPGSQVTCLDSNGKKTRFLNQVKLELRLDNLQIIHSRVEDFTPPDKFNGIVSRAFSSMENFSSWTRHLGDDQTRWFAMKGVHPRDELSALPSDFHLDIEHALTVPGCQGQRHLMILRRTV